MEVEKLNLPWLESGKPTTVAIYRKTKTSKTYYMIITNIHVDIINNLRATKPIIDHKYEIVELGIGVGFIKAYAKAYKIKKPQIIEK
jgi:hypothetical protein